MTLSTALGDYLHALRLSRGHERVSDFLRSSADLPFTDNYYRDVEAGRKRLSVEAAVGLRDALALTDAESVDFFWHYFKDVLPRQVHEQLFGKRGELSSDLAELNRLRDYDADILRRAVALAHYDSEELLAEDDVAVLTSNIHLLPPVHYIYMVAEAASEEVESVCRACGIDPDDPMLKNVLDAVSREDPRTRARRRRRSTLRVPRSESGASMKQEFVRDEIARSLSKSERPAFFDPSGTFTHSEIVALTPEQVQLLQRRLIDLVAELFVHSRDEAQLDDPDAEPYFVCTSISGRPEYHGRRLCNVTAVAKPRTGSREN